MVVVIFLVAGLYPDVCQLAVARELRYSLHAKHVLFENSVLFAARNQNLLALNHFKQGVERRSTIHVHRLKAQLAFFRNLLLLSHSKQHRVLLLHVIRSPSVRGQVANLRHKVKKRPTIHHLNTHVVLNLQDLHPFKQVCIAAAFAVKNSKFASLQLPPDCDRASNTHVDPHLANVCVWSQRQALEVVDVGLSNRFCLFLSYDSQRLVLKL